MRANTIMLFIASLLPLAFAFPIFDFEQFNNAVQRLVTGEDAALELQDLVDYRTMVCEFFHSYERVYAPAPSDNKRLYDETNDSQSNPMRAPKILYTVTVKNPSKYNVTVSVDYRDTSGKIETTKLSLIPGESHHFGKKMKSMGTWISSLVIQSIEIECEGHKYRMDAKDFGIATTTDHLLFTVVGAGKYADAKKGETKPAETFSLRRGP